MARSLHLSFICIPQSARALDQGGVEPRQAVSPKALRPWTIPLRYSVGWKSEDTLAWLRARGLHSVPNSDLEIWYTMDPNRMRLMNLQLLPRPQGGSFTSLEAKHPMIHHLDCKLLVDVP